MKSDDIARQIRQIYESDREVAAVYVFGSNATGRAHAQSDIDLAILFERRLPRWESYKRREKHFALLARALKTEPDVVDLEEVNLILLLEILQHGVIVIENNHERNVGFRARKIVECLDFQFIVRRCAEGMHRKGMEKSNGQVRRAISEDVFSPLQR